MFRDKKTCFDVIREKSQILEKSLAELRSEIAKNRTSSCDLPKRVPRKVTALTVRLIHPVVERSLPFKTTL